MSRIEKTHGALLAGFLALACASPALAVPQPDTNAPVQQDQTTASQYQADQASQNYAAPQTQPGSYQPAQPQPPQNLSAYPANPANYQPAQNAYYPPGQSPAASSQWQQGMTTQAQNGVSMRPVQEGSTTYITGGVGEDEQNELQAQASNYNLQITNSDKTGHFTDDTTLTIQSGNGRQMISASNTGPLFYAKLPPGTYTIDATNGAQHHVQQIKVSADKAKDIHFVWSDRNNEL